MTEGSPWADPDSPAQPGTPYAGPPSTAQPLPVPYAAPPGYPPVAGYPPLPGYGPTAYGPPGYPGYPTYPGYAGYPWQLVPLVPRKPGLVIGAAVLAFVQGGLVLLSSVYVVLLSSVAGLAGNAGGLATEGTVLGFVQVGSAVVLIIGGVMGLNSRRRRALVVLVVGFGVQVVLCVYWGVRLGALSGQIPGADPTRALLTFVFLFAASPVVGLGLVLLGPGRRWFEPAPAAPDPAGPR